MGLFDKLFKSAEPKYSDSDVVAICDGQIVDTKSIKDQTFAQEMMGKTYAFEPTSGEIVSPVNGTLEIVFPTGHAFGLRAKDGTGYLIHIGIDTVNLNGKGFTILKKQGETVKAGETVIKVDLDTVKQSYPVTTMFIITEPLEGKEYNFKSSGTVTKGEKIN